MLSNMFPLRSPRYFPSRAAAGGIRLLCFALGLALTAAAAPALAQSGTVPTATIFTPAPPAPAPPASVPPNGPTPSVAPAPGPGPATAAPVAPPPVAQPEPGTDLPSLAPSPLLEPRATSSAPPSETDSRSLTEFRPTLDAYGAWVENPSYGLVWVPRRDVVGDGFAPYVTSGHWALDTSGDWVWVSDYPFGSIVFHYGRWAYVSDSGWVWVPGYRYAPAWVTWRVPTGSYAYVGWAPLPPDYGWFGGVSVSLWWGYPTPWVFCPSAYAFHRHVDHYVVRDRGLVSRIAASSSRYVPARPMRRGAARPFAGPAPAEARIPAYAVPRERVQTAPERRYVPRDASPRGLAPRSLVRPPERRTETAAPRRPGDLKPYRPPERRTSTGADERRIEQRRVERPDRDRVERRMDRDRVERRMEINRERVRSPRPSMGPFSPGNARPRRSK